MPIDTDQEFSQLQRELRVGPSYDGMLPENQRKNRYHNVLPLDLTRVKLHDCPGAPRFGDDYINANFVTSDLVLTQAPLPETEEAFWHMIWQLDCQLIVMMTSIEENGKRKADCYWPTTVHEARLCGPFQINLRKVESLGGAQALLLDLQLDTRHRTVRLIRDERWADFRCPERDQEVLELLNSVDFLRAQSRGPTVLHCSAGLGRSGTLCTLLMLRDKKRSGQQLDVAQTVRELRAMRAGAVQSRCQYQLIHRMLPLL